MTRARDMQQFNRALGGDDDEEAFAQSQLRKALRLGPQQQPQQPPNPPHAHPHAVAGGNSFPPPAALAGAEPSITAAGTSTYPYPYPTNHMRGAGAGAQALVPGSSLHVPSYGGGGLGMAGGGGRLAAISAAGDAVVASLQEGLRRMQNSHKQVRGLELRRDVRMRADAHSVLLSPCSRACVLAAGRTAWVGSTATKGCEADRLSSALLCCRSQRAPGTDPPHSTPLLRCS